jgi:hypothetical protein
MNCLNGGDEGELVKDGGTKRGLRWINRESIERSIQHKVEEAKEQSGGNYFSGYFEFCSQKSAGPFSRVAASGSGASLSKPIGWHAKCWERVRLQT